MSLSLSLSLHLSPSVSTVNLSTFLRIVSHHASCNKRAIAIFEETAVYFLLQSNAVAALRVAFALHEELKRIYQSSSKFD